MEGLLLQSLWRTFPLFLCNPLVKPGLVRHFLALQSTWSDGVEKVCCISRCAFVGAFLSRNHFTKSFRAGAPSACIYIFSTLRIFWVFVDYICTFCVYEDQGFHMEPLHSGPADPSQFPGPPFFKCAATAALSVSSAAVSSSSGLPGSFATLQSPLFPLTCGAAAPHSGALNTSPGCVPLSL